MKKKYECPKAEIVNYSTPDIVQAVAKSNLFNFSTGNVNKLTYEVIEF